MNEAVLSLSSQKCVTLQMQFCLLEMLDFLKLLGLCAENVSGLESCSMQRSESWPSQIASSCVSVSAGWRWNRFSISRGGKKATVEEKVKRHFHCVVSV